MADYQDEFIRRAGAGATHAGYPGQGPRAKRGAIPTAADARKAGTRGGSVAVGPGAVATSASAGVSFWWYILAAVVGAVGWEVLTSQVTPVRLLLKWRRAT